MARSRGSAKGAPASKAKRRKKAKVKQPDCEAIATSTGKRCTNPAKIGSTFCGTHSGKAGAPSKFTDDVRNAILEWTALGGFKTTVCKAAGISPVTLASWLERGELAREQGKDADEFAEFSAAYEKAEADGELRLLARLQKQSGEGSTRATLEILKRRYRERWGDKVQAEISGAGGGPIETSSVDPAKLPVDKRRELVKLLREAQKEPENN